MDPNSFVDVVVVVVVDGDGDDLQEPSPTTSTLGPWFGTSAGPEAEILAGTVAVRPPYRRRLPCTYASATP